MLLQEGPLRLMWWQWLTLLSAIPLLAVAAWLLQRVVMRTLRRFAGWTGPAWDDEAIPRLRGPVLLFLLALLLAPLTAMLQLERAADGLFIDLAKALGVIAVFWALVVAVGVVQRRLLERAAVTGRTEARSLIPLGARILRILLLFMGLVAVLAHAARPGSGTAAAVRLVMAAFLVAGLAGLYYHYSANIEFQLEGDPTLAGRALFMKALEAKTPPALAPGVMVQLGLLGLAYTFRHRER